MRIRTYSEIFKSALVYLPDWSDWDFFIHKQPLKMFSKKGVLKNFAGKHLYLSLFFNKVTTATLLKKRLWHSCFPMNFLKSLHIFYGTLPVDCFCWYTRVIKFVSYSMEFRQATLLENGNQNCKILTQILPLRMTVLSVETFQKLKKLLYVEYAS